MMVVIRQFRADDAPFMAAIYHAAVHGPATHLYSDRQRDAWSPAPVDEESVSERASDGRVTLVATDATDRPVAYADLERDGHIDHFYCHPDVSRKGVAAELYAAIENAARDGGIERLYVEASEPARRFFSRQGFAVEARRDFDVNGTPIHNFAMTKRLRAIAGD